jgi:putative SOS response-associated peptidase YedK
MCFSVQIDRQLPTHARLMRAKIDKKTFESLQHLLTLPSYKYMKVPDAEGRIFPNTFAPLLTSQSGQRILRPMRYRLRPQGSREEVPTKFNLFNARSETLSTKKTWMPLLGKQHGVLMLRHFYEWVVDVETQKKRMVRFTPITEKESVYLTPCLWDFWENPQATQESFYSFALITQTPPPEVEKWGHDRCPIQLHENDIDQWMELKGSSQSEAFLKTRAQPLIRGEWAQS